MLEDVRGVSEHTQRTLTERDGVSVGPRHSIRYDVFWSTRRTRLAREKIRLV